MDFKKLVPWNWFKHEEEASGSTIPVQHAGQTKPQIQLSGPVDQLHQEMDQLFNNFFQGFGVSPYTTGSLFPNSLTNGFLKPTVDIGASEKEYAISIEVPGVEQKDITLEITNNILTIRGEKKQEKEEKEKDYYRMERSYGSFQRVLALPDDANQEEIKATFKNGVLTITMPRKTIAHTDVKQIEIN
jgi:HSP20 family protein